MTSMRWLGFFVCNSVTKPMVHFFPNSATASAPYPIICTLTVFGTGVPKTSVTLEGARLSQPDGVPLDEIFEGLSGGAAGLVGLQVELVSQQRRVDLSASQVIIELIQGRNSTRYFAAPMNSKQLITPETFADIEGSSLDTTLVAVNPGAKAVQAAISEVAEHEGEDQVPAMKMSLDPYSVSEFKYKSSMAGFGASDSPFIRSDSGRGLCPLSEDSDVSFFALYRDSKSKSPMTVCAL